MDLRPYQKECIEAVDANWDLYNRQLIVLPTGAGKTVVFSTIASMNPGRTLILAHRDELVTQALEKLHAVTGIIAGREQGKDRAMFSDQVVVGSVQSMANRTHRWPADHFRLIICDEAHRSTAVSWRKVLDHFGKFNRILGVTATPTRADGTNLGELYEHVAYKVGMFDLIRQGYLSPIKIKTLPIKIDVSGVKKQAGDLATSDLGHVLEPYLPAIASTIRREIKNRRLLCFLPLVSTSHIFCNYLRAEGLSVGHIDGKSKNRKQILKDFAAGKFQVLSNAMLLTEGYDDPGIDAVCNLRLTSSKSLFTQIIGRGTRTAAGKDFLLVLDFLWQSEKHSLVSAVDLVPGEPALHQAMKKIAEQKVGTEEPLELIELSESVAAQREATILKAIAKNQNRKSEFLSAEEFASRCGAKEEFKEEYSWQMREITPKQVELLEKAGVDIASVRGVGHASALIDVWINFKNNQPASDKQKASMKRAGYPNAENATMKEARAFFVQKRRQ